MTRLIDDPDLTCRFVMTACPVCLQKLLILGGESWPMERICQLPHLMAEDENLADDVHQIITRAIWRAIAQAELDRPDLFGETPWNDVCGTVFFKRPGDDDV